MIKLQEKVSPTTIVELEAAKQKDLFKLRASAHEVFGEKQCGLCKSNDIRPVWRVVTSLKNPRKPETFEFPEYHCQGLLENDGKRKRCGAKLSLGTINDDTGTLFPQRRLIFDKGVPPDMGRLPTKAEKEKGINGDYGPHNGWTRYKGKPEEESAGEAGQ